MTVRVQYYLVCTNCNNQFISPCGGNYGETAKEIRELAAGQGWVYKKVENGTFWDICPSCQTVGLKRKENILTEAYKLGQENYYDNKYGNNPYDKGTEDYEEYEQGWKDIFDGRV